MVSTVRSLHNQQALSTTWLRLSSPLIVDGKRTEARWERSALSQAQWKRLKGKLELHRFWKRSLAALPLNNMALIWRHSALGIFCICVDSCRPMCNWKALCCGTVRVWRHQGRSWSSCSHSSDQFLGRSIFGIRHHTLRKSASLHLQIDSLRIRLRTARRDGISRILNRRFHGNHSRYI